MSKCEIFAKLKSIRVSVFSQILRQCLSSEKKYQQFNKRFCVATRITVNGDHCLGLLFHEVTQ